MDVPGDPDVAAALIADGQWGVVKTVHLARCGLSPTAVADRVGKKRLRVLYRGVYAVGHTELRREGHWLAAVFASGQKAVLSHADAAAYWNLLPPTGRRIHVTTQSRSGRGPDPLRIVLHRVGTLRSWETTLSDGMPITTVARTLLDLAPGLRQRALEDVVAQADRLGLFDLVAVRRCLDQHPRQHGAPALRALLDRLAGVGAADLRSTTERLLLELCDDYQLPTPSANLLIAGFLVDFHWPGTSLIVETDGFTYHQMPTVFESDRDRDQILTLAGYTVARLTYQQLTREPAKSADRLRRLIAKSGSL